MPTINVFEHQQSRLYGGSAAMSRSFILSPFLTRRNNERHEGPRRMAVLEHPCVTG
jgi:hypothetical protein